MNSTLTYKKVELLPPHLKIEVINFIDFLLAKEKKSSKIKSQKNKPIAKLQGSISEEEAIEWHNKILDCRKIDLNDW
jgi:hypothetical protein